MDIYLSVDKDMVLKKQTYTKLTKENILSGDARFIINYHRNYKESPKVVQITSLMFKTYEPVKNNIVIIPSCFSGANKINVVALVSENGDIKQTNKIEIEIEQ